LNIAGTGTETATVDLVDEKAFREFERAAHDRIVNSYHSFFVPITEHAAEPLLDAAEHGVLLEAVQEADAKPPADLPAGAPMFRYSEDGEFRGLLASAGLESATISSHNFTYRLPSASALWEGAMGSLARTSALLRAQTREVQQRIRTTFERLANAYLTPAGLDLPMAFKVCRARRPALF
jgi:hypothetical protein